MRSGAQATWDDLARVHPEAFLRKFKDLSDNGGGEIGLRTPFAQGGFEMASLSAGLSKAALYSVLNGEVDNAYALSRPPGHHCLPDFPNGFCLYVHHGNGTEAIFLDRDDVLTISLHQERNYPLDTGDAEDRGVEAGEGFNMNIPLPPGGGHALYLDAMERLVIPALTEFKPDVIIIACGFDAAAIDPLSRMLASADTFRAMTEIVMETASDLCGGRLMMSHEGGYSEVYVPFCGHHVLQQMSGSSIHAEDPLGATFEARQPSNRLARMHSEFIDDLEQFFF